MAIEVPVRKEIASFVSRPVFGLTVRQLICCGVAIPLAVGAYLLCTLYFNLTTNTAGTITIFLVLPIFVFGMFKKDGYTLEKYIKIVWEHRYTQQKTFFTTENALALYMSEDEYKNDLSKIMLAYSDKATTAQAETTITYHLTEKEERQGILQAGTDCRAVLKQHRAYCIQHEKDLRLLKQNDRQEIADLKHQHVGSRETNVTYHLTKTEERQGILQAGADCRAVLKQHRAFCSRQKQELRTLKRRDWWELAHLKSLDVGGMETNITYHLTRREERQGILLAKADCRAVADAYRTACRLRLKGERSATHGNTDKKHRA